MNYGEKVIYKNCKIINPENYHEYTFVLLHSMCSDNNYFNQHIEYIKDKYEEIYKKIKFILPDSPIMDVDYPDNKLTQVNSWYNYYTCYDGKNKLDKIDKKQFDYQSIRITSIIINEACILNSFKKIYLVGVSQGGTLLMNILNMLPRNIGGIMCLKTIYMFNYTRVLKYYKNTPIFIYSGLSDEIYPFKLQKRTFRKLLKKGFYLNWSKIPFLDHCTLILSEYEFIIQSFIKTLNSIKI